MATAMTFRSRKVSQEKSAVAKAAGAAASGAKKTFDSFTRKALAPDAASASSAPSPADIEKTAEKRNRRVHLLARILIVLVAILCMGTVLNLGPGKSTTTTDSSTKFIASAAVGSTVRAESVALHRGRTTHVWQIELRNDAGELTCVSRITMAIQAER